MPSNGPGRPSLYTEELAARICERLAAGETLRSVCRDPEMPDRDTVRRWKNSNEEFYAQYTRAREDGYEDWADELLEIVDSGSGDAARDRLRFDARRWLLSKALPKFADKLAHTGADGIGPVLVTWQPPSE